MKNILTNTTDSIWAIDRNYRILYLNNAFRIDFKKAFNIELNEGDNIIETLPTKISNIWKDRYNKSLNGERYTFEEELKGSNDNTIYIHVSLTPIYTGKKITGVTCFGRDITQEKLNKINLHRYSILLKSSLESQKDTILLSIDRDFNYMYFNTAHYEVMKYAYNVEITNGMNILDCISDKDDRNAALENYTRALNGESHSNIRIYGEQNKEYYESFFNPIKDEKNIIIGATALARNITKRIEQEEAIKIANITKDKFFSIISHDLRSPIFSIMSLTKIMHEEFDKYDEVKIKSYLKCINKGLDSTYTLLEDLLLWSKSQNNSIVFNSEKINLSDITNSILNVFDQSLKRKELTIIKNFPPSFHINADKHMISTIIRNLLSNAIKFSHNQKSIEIGFNKLIDENDNKVLIYVNDSGVGIKKENISKLFNIGEDISTPGTDNEKGSGLGLVICKEFIENHSGKITIDSEVNKGTKISIIFPQ